MGKASGSATVVRWVITHVNGDGDRVLTEPKQGRYTYDTMEEAQRHLTDLSGPGGLPRVLTVSAVATLEVRSVRCWAHHHDPVGLYVTEGEVQQDPVCFACDGMLEELGTLGTTTHYRCRACGLDSSRTGGG